MEDTGPEYRRWWAELMVRVANINQMYARLKWLKSLPREKHMLKVEKKKAEAMFTALGFAKVENWSDQRLQDKVEGLADFAEEEGDELPELKGADKKLFDSILKAIEDEDEIDVTAGAKDEEPEDEDEDVQDSDSDDDGDEDEEQEEDDEEESEEEDDDEDEPEAEADDDEEEDEEEPAPTPARVAKAPAKTGGEEFVGIRELVAILTRVATLLEGLASGSGKSAPTQTAPSANGDTKSTPIKVVVGMIRDALSKASSAEDAVEPKEVAAKLFPKIAGRSKWSIKQRVILELSEKMPADGYVVKKSGTKFWIKSKK